MNIQAKKQYMETLRETYLKGDRKKKTEILDEYCRNTNQDPNKATIPSSWHSS